MKLLTSVNYEAPANFVPGMLYTRRGTSEVWMCVAGIFSKGNNHGYTLVNLENGGIWMMPTNMEGLKEHSRTFTNVPKCTRLEFEV